MERRLVPARVLPEAEQLRKYGWVLFVARQRGSRDSLICEKEPGSVRYRVPA